MQPFLFVRYVKKQGGGSGTSGGTSAKKSKAAKPNTVGTDSEDELQTVDYFDTKNAKKTKPIMSAWLDKS